MNQIWQLWQASLQDSIVNDIIKASEQYPVVSAGLGYDGSIQKNDLRSSKIRWVNPADENSKFISDLLWYYGREANKNAFGFDINYLLDIQYTKYIAEENGKYDWHYDTFWANPTTYDRKLSIIIQLSDSADYEGGNFEIDPFHPQLPADKIREKGSVIVFPSFLSHRVTPVTKGERISLVSWIQGPKFR
jgi:PKHD-type hydroxylase